MIKVHATLISELVIDIEAICSSKGRYIFFLFLPFVLPFIFLLFCHFYLFLSTLVVYCPRYPETLIGRYLLGTNLNMGLVSKRYLPFRRIVFPPALSTSLISKLQLLLLLLLLLLFQLLRIKKVLLLLLRSILTFLKLISNCLPLCLSVNGSS